MKKPENSLLPKWPEKLFTWICHHDQAEEIIGDLQERYHLRAQRMSPGKARNYYFKDVLAYIPSAVLKRKSSSKPTFTLYPDMINNYFKVAFRNLLRHKAFSFINIFGLAVAMSVCMLIILMLADQRSYDQFHVNKDSIYRILSKPKEASQPYATTPFPLVSTLKKEYANIDEATQLFSGVGGDAVYKQQVVEMRGFFTDPAFFTIFSYELAQGNSQNALAEPNSMVITGEVARRLFNNENPIGKTVQFTDRGLHYLQKSGKDSPPVSWGNFTITGIIADKNYKSHLAFDVLVSSASLQALYRDNKIINLTDKWEDHHQTWTYVLLDPTKTQSDLNASLQQVVRQKYTSLKEFDGFQLIGQKFSDINTDLLSNEITYRLPLMIYYFLSVLAIVIMVSACLNYTNLSVARALTRAKEIGVRKVNGAKRKDLIFQFLSESIMTALLSLLMAIILLTLIKPAFKGLWINQFLHFELESTLVVYLLFFGLALLIGIIAGVYPALHLSGFQPVYVLKNLDRMRPGKLGMRKVLSVFQFVISLFFITSSILIYKQFQHFLEFDYKFNTNNIINIELQGNDYQKVSAQLRSIPGVSAISATDIIPATGTSNGIGLRKPGTEAEFTNMWILHTDEKFIDNLQIKLLAGKHLPASGESADRFILVNESAVKELGYTHPSQIIGQTLEVNWNKEVVEVIGVVENFRYKLLLNTNEIGPLVLHNQPENFKYVNVQVAGNGLNGTISKIEDTWKNIDPIHPLKYEFFDEQLAATHQGILDVVSVIGFIAFLAITIACLGMLGMATYTAERKMKEVGIRKVLGAGNMGIMLLLSRGFLTILFISVLIGAPLSYMANNVWLQNFPNRVDFGLDILLLGSALLFTLGIVTIGSQTIRVSRTNPVDSLRMD
ncbi:FtsX-like permease family protein [Rhodocytophaga rosea]|uniref:FtsX-like permease family protein n=1 Tax=Rhodocytophaga rosea TaxID=2704465 RepID=A0A6C0GNN7_9BACT|nr:ABC transporter permease [Rhodocytophaga rosea]QHT69649.1 FtsX-like permease family protein [Rhodocytophaga rosea]